MDSMSVYKKWTIMKHFNKNKIKKMGPEQGKDVVFSVDIKIFPDVHYVGKKSQKIRFSRRRRCRRTS